MDGSRFDALTRTLTVAGSRRRALGGLLAGASGVLGTTAGDAAAKKKKPCPACKKRKKGKCKGQLPDGASCPGGTCQGGKCVPPTSECAGQPDNARCGELGRGHCLAGVCNPRPTCGEHSTLIEDGDCSVCCSGECEPITSGPDAGLHLCTLAYPGQHCYASGECRGGRACIGHRCGDFLVCPADAPDICNSYPSVEGCIPNECQGPCHQSCDSRDPDPCDGCEPYLACTRDPFNPEDGERCRPQVPPTTGVSCPPQCASRRCGPDGCGGTCGTCPDGEICNQGQCLCSGNEREICGGACLAFCATGTVSHPQTCRCCIPSGYPSGGARENCCSGTAVGSTCVGPTNSACSFNEQCDSTNCVAGRCEACFRGFDYCATPDSWRECSGNATSGFYICLQAVDGNTRCGRRSRNVNCNGCSNDLDCQEELGQNSGAFCVRDTGSGCDCPDGQTFCALPLL